MKTTARISAISFYRPAYGFTNSFFPKYKQGDKVFVRTSGQKVLGTIVGAYLDENMNFIVWKVNVRNIRFCPKKDPKCPWNK